MLVGNRIGNFLRSSEIIDVNFAISWRLTTSLELQELSSEVSFRLVEVIYATEARSLAVKVARLEMALTVSCWYV